MSLDMNKFDTLLVANRGEIACRVMRTARAMGLRTVAVYSDADANARHVREADEAIRLGPAAARDSYLKIGAVVDAAQRTGAGAIHPGYGFLSENGAFVQALETAGITFVGPPASAIAAMGDKSAAKARMEAAGVPLVPGYHGDDQDDNLLRREADKIGYPVLLKASAGGGGKGMRVVESGEQFQALLDGCRRESRAAFGDDRMLIEKYLTQPRHVEVQVFCDAHGNGVYLFERDCSVQRRHQKVVEIAPAPNLDPEIADALHADALKFAKALGYQNAGTVEFLLETDGPRAGKHVFIEMNPRVQVEHTVTEEITDVDIVASQMRIAAGAGLEEIGLRQDEMRIKGAALQCRITTEDPANSFRPDTGTITAYRSAGGAGVRLDGGTVHAGAAVSPHFDSMLVKLSCRGRDFAQAVGRAKRALAEFRIRGVSSNIGFLQAVLDDPAFVAGDLSTSFIEERPQLFDARVSADRGSKLLDYLADVTVNRPHGEPGLRIRPGDKLPNIDLSASPAPGSRDRLAELGPEGFARALREQTALAVTDTTFRDAHQSLLATRVRTRDLLAVAGHVSRMTPELLSIEAWGGATYDVALRFLGEDPWERLEALRAAVPNINLQMLLRGRNTVGYTPYPTEVTDAFVDEAARTGIDIFRIFDALNDVEQMRPAIEAVRGTNTALAEVALCYTSDILDPTEELYTLDYYLRLAEQIVDAGAHVLAIKDMAGLLRPAATAKLVTALRENFDLPVHVHTHDTAGGQLATLYAAAAAGADAVDAASAAMAGTTSQPSLSALVAAFENTDRDTGISLDAVSDLEPYWESVRKLYAPFESGLAGPTGRVYRHEIPGGQLSNLRQQAVALGLGERFEDIEHMYAAADSILGHLVKVTPSSKVVGDLALHLVGAGVSPEEFAENPDKFDIPDSVIGFLSGDLGDPPGGWPEPFRTKALAGRSAKPLVEHLEPADAAALETPGRDRKDKLNELLFPGPTKEFQAMRSNYGDLSVVETSEYLYGLTGGEEHAVELAKGKNLLIGVQAIGGTDERGMRSVMFTLNGQLRPLQVRDRSVESEVKTAEKADPNNRGHVGSPFAGVVTMQVHEGDKVAVGDTVATIEAMKMEATITTQTAGTISRVAIADVQQLEGGDLVVVIDA